MPRNNILTKPIVKSANLPRPAKSGKTRTIVTEEMQAGITKMFLEDVLWREIDEKYNLSMGYSRRLIKRWRVMEGLPEPERQRINALRAARQDAANLGRGGAKPYQQTPLVGPQPEMMFGDPAPGRSALDKRRSQL